MRRREFLTDRGQRRPGEPAGNLAAFGLRGLCSEQSDQRRVHRAGQPEHARPPRFPPQRRRPGGGRLRRQYGELRLPEPEALPRPQAGPGHGQRSLRREDQVGPVPGLPGLHRLPRAPRPRRHRRRRGGGARPLARPHDDRGGEGGQGHLLREAPLADRRAGAGDGQGRRSSTTGSCRPAASTARAHRPASPASWSGTGASAGSSGSRPPSP